FVVLPSLMDNLPNTCLEAMGCGRVVVATAGICFEQIIEQSRSGILVEANDSTALAAGMHAAANLSQWERQEIGSAGAARIAQIHPSLAIPRLLNYYRHVLDSFHLRTNGSAALSETDVPREATVAKNLSRAKPLAIQTER